MQGHLYVRHPYLNVLIQSPFIAPFSDQSALSLNANFKDDLVTICFCRKNGALGVGGACPGDVLNDLSFVFVVVFWLVRSCLLIRRKGGNEGGAEPLLEMIWVEERQLCDELSSARHGMACASQTTAQFHNSSLASGMCQLHNCPIAQSRFAHI